MKHKMIPLCLILIGILSTPAHAHRAWVLPGSTVLAGDSPWVTVDAAISNDIFHTDYRAMGADAIQVQGADGQAMQPQNLHTGRYRTVFDLQLEQSGTYRVYIASNGLSARWTNEDGSRGFFPGRGQQPDDEAFAREVPQDADDLSVSMSSRRIETFITAGAPDFDVIEPSGRGLELKAHTHPNDLFAGETANFQLLIDGEPAAGAEVTVLAGGMRYRDQQDAIELTTDAEGMLNINWPDAGMYWFSARYSDDQAQPPATTRQGSYTATFEVFPG